MRLYDNSHPLHYEELKTFYPAWYREILEMDAIWYALGRQLDGVRAGIIQAVDNGFISRADVETVTALENFLYIPYDGTRSIEERRMLVATYFLGHGHIGEKEIKQIVGTFTKAACQVSFANSRIEVMITWSPHDAPLLLACLIFLLTKIPAHLRLGALTKVTPEITTTNQHHANTAGVQHRIIFDAPSPKDLVFAEHYRANTISLQQKIIFSAPLPPTATLDEQYRANNITLQGGIIIGR